MCVSISLYIALFLNEKDKLQEKVRFLLGGWAEASEGRVLSTFLTNWGGTNLFYSQPGEGHSFFGKEKITPCRFYFVYTSKATSQD